MANPSVLLLGGDSLLGKEFRERFEAAKPSAELVLAAAGENVTAVLAVPDEDGEDGPEVIPALDGDQIAGASAAVLAGTPAEAAAAWEMIRQAKPSLPVVDLTGELESVATTRTRAPFLEAGPIPASEFVHVIPHPAAYLLAHFLTLLHDAQPVRRTVATVLEPASQSGRRGIDELQRQAVALLSFKPLPKEYFDAQAAFNLLARPGAESQAGWAARERRLERDLASLLAIDGKIPMPSVRLVHAPVFHGYTLSLWVEFAQTVRVASLVEALRDGDVDIRGEDLDPPDNVGMASESGYAVGAIEADRNDSRACWFWLVADNFRTAADLAVEVVTELL